MKNAISFVALFALLMSTGSIFAHDGHGLGGAHWHATDVLGYVAVAVLAALAWFKRK
jgi:Co/Zn/Cd efflux system component